MGLPNRNRDHYAAPPLIKNITQIGNSKGIILPQAVLEQLGWDNGGQVELRIDGENLLVLPVGRRYATAEEAKAAGDRVFTKRRRLMEKLAK